ncbi:MAG: hypothetical protein IJG32_03365, partial [Selenomonadaceae bacterium]|nr:hypothetical protein [Selenomonadaceae bacterium]
DKGNPKPKLPNGGKWDCLFNAVQEFGAENFHVIADNCTEETIKALRATGLSLELTANGNAGTCRYIFEEVINRYAPDDNLYLLEDDYLHLPGSRVALLEGLEIADYVTLYDHPDMYHPDGKGDNPFVHDDQPKSSIFLTAHSHWRSTVSTTMTFAAKVKTLLEDRDVWKRFCGGKIPADFGAFIILTGQDDLNEAKRFTEKGWENLAELVVKNYLSRRKKRLLISPLPAFATHTETNYLSPLIDWSKV